MSARGVLTALEDLGVQPGLRPGRSYRQWRIVLLRVDASRWEATTGRFDIIERARAWLGERVYVARGGKEGIVGGIWKEADYDKLSGRASAGEREGKS